jgi:hypothetical protein
MTSTSKLSAEFDGFLFATICDEGGEGRLSVISALARLDLDPWAEAAGLARMPEAGAARRLTSLLAGVGDARPLQPDRAAIAARLVALLPTSPATKVTSRQRAADRFATPQARFIQLMSLVFLASMAASVLIGNLAPRSSAHATSPTPAAAARR